jgi:hypothetical protein
MRAAVILSNLHPKGCLLASLQALLEQTVPVPIVLADPRGITAAEAAALPGLERSEPRLRVLRRPGLNRAQLLNEAVAQTPGDLLLFTESHCQPHRDWVARFLDAFRPGGVEVATGPLVPAALTTLMSRLELEWVEAGRVRRARAGTTGSALDCHNTAITRACFERMGGLDPRLPAMGDPDLGARLHQRGIPIVRLPDNGVRHVYDGTLRASTRAIRAQGRDRGRLPALRDPAFVERYFEGGRLLRLRPWVAGLRWPMVAGLTVLRALEAAGFHVAAAAGLHPVARRLFAEVALASSRLGAASTLGKPIR